MLWRPASIACFSPSLGVPDLVDICVIRVYIAWPILRGTRSLLGAPRQQGRPSQQVRQPRPRLTGCSPPAWRSRRSSPTTNGFILRNARPSSACPPAWRSRRSCERCARGAPALFTPESANNVSWTPLQSSLAARAERGPPQCHATYSAEVCVRVPQRRMVLF